MAQPEADASARPSGQSLSADVVSFKSLIYSRYTFIGRCRLNGSLNEADEFCLLQGVQLLICKSHSTLLEALDRGVGALSGLEGLCNSFASSLDELCRLHSPGDAATHRSLSSHASVASDVDCTACSDERTADVDDSVRCESTHFDWEKCALDEAFSKVAKRNAYNFKSLASRFDKRFYDCFLHSEGSESDILLKDGDALPLRIDAEGLLRLCKETPSIGTVCNNIRRYRAECRSKLSQMHNVDTRLAGTSAAPSGDPQPSVRLPVSFERMIVMLKAKICSQSVFVNIRLWQLEGRSNDYICDQFLSHLKDLRDDVLRCPCDYSKWVRILIASEPVAEMGALESTSYDAVYQHLCGILQFASSSGFSGVFDLCIDVMFCLSVRHPNACQTLECCLNYLKTVVIPTLPHPCGDPTTPRPDNSAVWLPRLSASFESLIDLEYLSLHHPLLMNSSEGGSDDSCDRVFSTSITKLGCYVMRVDVSIDEVSDSASIHKPASTSSVFRITIRHSQKEPLPDRSVTFVSDGHHMMVFDSGFALLDLHSLKSYSVEFLFSNGNLLVYLNGTRFYMLDLCEAWQLDLSTGGAIDVSIAVDSSCVHLEQPWSLTPGLRSEMMRRQLVGCCGFPLASSGRACLLNSLYERHFFMAKVTSSLHNMLSRIFHSFRGHSSPGFTWSAHFVRYLRLWFEILFCNLECISSICTYFTASGGVNALTLWRLISETILSCLSVLRLSLSIPTGSVKLPSDMLELVASCFVACVRFRAITSGCHDTDHYHLQFDLDSLASAINVAAISFVSACPDIFSQIFLTLRLEVLVEILVHTVSVEQFPAHGDAGGNVSIEALKFLSSGDCIAIFTKRALSQNMPGFLRDGAKFVGDVDNHWWKTILKFLESGKCHLQESRISVDPVGAEYCTCEAVKYGDSVASPFFTCCYGCVRRYCTPTDANTRTHDYQPLTGPAALYSCPRPHMLLCRLLLKHGILFLCLNTSVSYKEAGWDCVDRLSSTVDMDYRKAFERFCDWRGDILYGRLDGLLKVDNANTYFRLFNKDDVSVLEYIVLRLLRYSEFAYGLLSENLVEVSSDLLSEFGSSAHNFINTLSIVDALSYMVELFEYMTVVDGHASVVHRTFVACANLLPCIFRVLILMKRCIKRYSTFFEAFSLFMNYVVLQFHSLAYLLGKVITYMYNHCKRYSKEHLLSVAELGALNSEVSRIKGIEDQRGVDLPQWVLYGAWLEFEDRSDFYTGLRRLTMLLQDFHYRSSHASFTEDFNVGRPPASDGTTWALGILRGDAACIDRLRPYYRSLHPSLGVCQLGFVAVFIHLLGGESGSVEFCTRSASQAVLQVLRQLQNVQTLFATMSDLDRLHAIRQGYLDDIHRRCLWVVENTRGGLYYVKNEPMPRAGHASTPGVTLEDDDAPVVTDGVKRCSSIPHLLRASKRDPRNFERGFSDIFLTRRSAGRQSSAWRSHSVGAARCSSPVASNDPEVLRVDIRPHMGDVIGFLLYGPSAAVCQSDLQAERLSAMCRHSMWRCVNALTSLLVDTRLRDDGSNAEKDHDSPSYTRPLLVHMTSLPSDDKVLVCSDGMHAVLKLLWYCIVKTTRCMVIRSASDSVVPSPGASAGLRSSFDAMLERAQSTVLEKLCSWYLSSGVCNLNYAIRSREHLPSWVRISLPFFSLLFSLGLDPLNNPRYATPIFQQMLSVLQPLRLGPSGAAGLDSCPTKGVRSIVVLFVSYEMLRLCNVSVNAVFQTLWSSRYSKRDFIKVSRGLLYVWVKTTSDVQPPIEKPELTLRLLWSLKTLDPCTVESDLEPLNAMIRGLTSREVAETPQPAVPGELIMWHMYPREDSDIVDVSFIDKHVSTVSSDVDVCDITIPIYINITLRHENAALRAVDLSVLQYLGGKLEVESGSGIWSQLNGGDPTNSVHPMRVHLHYLLRVLIWMAFSPGPHGSNTDTGNVEISYCLCRLLLRSLREVAAMLVIFNANCACAVRSKDHSDYVSFRYIPSNIDGESASISVEGMISSACNKCTTNLVCRCEIETFWVSILNILTKEIDSTSHYRMVNYLLNCLLTTFTLGDEEIDVLLSSSNLGPAFCELFVSCTRKLGQEHLCDSGYVISTADAAFANLVSPTLHGMFLYRWLPPLQRAPQECLYSSSSELFQSVLVTQGYRRSIRVVSDSSSDPFSTLPHSDNFVTHRASADFEADISGHTLHITRAQNMGGIVLFRIPINMGSTTSMQGSVNFFILSPGRFGITVAPADCVFGSVIDLFDRNDVVGFMTSLCPPFVHDVFAATINYRVGDVLSASFNVERQEDGQVCLRTELLIAGNSIGSVLEVVYDPATQNEPMRRMSLVFIFQDPQTIVYNGLNENSSAESGRLVSRETLSTFRSDTASDQPVEFPVYSSGENAERPMSPTGSGRRLPVRLPSVTPISRGSGRNVVNRVERAERGESSDRGATSEEAFSVSSDEQRDHDDVSVEHFPSLEKFTNTDWDVDYDLRADDELEVGSLPEDVLRLCKDEIWDDIVNPRGSMTSAKSAIMFAESVQLYQAILTTNIPLLSGVKEEVVGQLCMSFETLCGKLQESRELGDVERAALRDCYSWLCVLGCDVDSGAWKKKAFTRDAKCEKVSDFSLPWLLGSSSTLRSCCSKLSSDSCRKLLASLSEILSVPCIASAVMYVRNTDACLRFAPFAESKTMFPTQSLLLAFGAACLLCCVLLARVLCEKGIRYGCGDDDLEFETACIDQLVCFIMAFVDAPGMSESRIGKDRVLSLLSLLGIETCDVDEVSSVSASSREGDVGGDPVATSEGALAPCDSFESISPDQFWSLVYDAVHSQRLSEHAVQVLDGHKVPDIAPNTKMFATCDYSYHCSARVPSASRHTLRRSLRPNIVEHNVFDLAAVLLSLCPEYFACRLVEGEQEKGLQVFRATVKHFVRCYDFNSTDYWHWGYMAGSVSVGCMDQYSFSVDPLYGWQRLFYMEKDPSRLDEMLAVLFTELVYCVAMLVHDQSAHHGLAHVVHWILDAFLRHPLCSGSIRKRFVTNYVWSIVHTLLVNCSALPCKLAVVASRLSAWMIPVSTPAQLSEIFMVTQYCGTSALHRVTGLCNFYNILDLDTFTNIELKRQDHAAKLASAVLVHLFASTLAMLLEKGCDPVFDPDDILSIAHYMMIGKNSTTYSEKFVRCILGIPQDLVLQACIPPHYRSSGGLAKMTRTFITTSRSKSISLTLRLKRICRVVLCADRECTRIISETLLYPDVCLRVPNGQPVYVDCGDPLPFDLMRQRCCLPAVIVYRDVSERCKEAVFRIGFTARGIREVCSPSSKVHFEDGFLYLEVVGELEISQVVVSDEIIWHYGRTTVCLTLPSSVELLRPYIAVSHPSDPSYHEDVMVVRNTASLPVGSLCYYIASQSPPSLESFPGYVRLSVPFRSGISLSNVAPQVDCTNAAHLDACGDTTVVDVPGTADLGAMCTHMALPFDVSVKVLSSRPDFFVGLEWLGLRFLWFANGTIQCPMDPPLFRSASMRTSRVSVSGTGFAKDDVVGLRFAPDECKLLFVVNDKIAMVLDFRKFYQPYLSPHTLSESSAVAANLGGSSLSVLQNSLFNAILSDDLSTVRGLVYFITGGSVAANVRISLFETALSDTQPPEAQRKPYDQYNAVYLCCLLNRLEILRCISVVGDVNFDGRSGPSNESPLMAAAKNGCTAVISYLLSIMGADVNGRDRFGNTALIHALVENDAAPFGKRCSSVLETVDMLVTFGADVQLRNNAGCGILDLFPSGNDDLQDMCMYVVERYNLRRFFGPNYGKLHRAWPGLLGGSEFVCGVGNGDQFHVGDVALNAVTIDGSDLMVEQAEVDKSYDFGERVAISRGTKMDQLESILEKIRTALLLLTTKLSDSESAEPVHLKSVVHLNHGDSLGSEISTVLRGFVHDLKAYSNWSKSRVLHGFVRLATDYCNQVTALPSDSAVVLSLLNFERCVSELRLFPRADTSPLTTLQLYRGVFQGCNVFHCDFSLYSQDYMAVSCLDRLSRYLDTFRSHRATTLDFDGLELPSYCRERIDVTVRCHAYAFDRLRSSLNRDVTTDIDFALHCVSDLLNSAPATKQMIAAMVMQCQSRLELQSRLPPLDSPLWNGIYTTVDHLLECLMKLKGILRNRLSREHLDEVDIFMLLQHMAKVLDDSVLRDYILNSNAGSDTSSTLRAVVDKLQIGDVRSAPNDNGMRIISYSSMHNDVMAGRRSEFGTRRCFEVGDCVISACCYMLVSDRIALMDHVNETFKLLAPIVGTVLNQPLVEYLPLEHQLLPTYESFVSAPPCWRSSTLVLQKNVAAQGRHPAARDEFGVCLGPPDIPVHWSTYLGNRCLIRRSVINDMYSKIFLSLQSLNRERPYFSIRVDRGIAATASSLKHTLWFQSCSQILNCNPNILRARNNQRPFMVVFRGEGATDFGGPFQELLSSISNEVMSPLTLESRLTKKRHFGCVRCANTIHSHGLFQDTVMLKFSSPIHPMLRLLKSECPEPFKISVHCGDLGVSCSTGCCSVANPLSVVDEPSDELSFRENCQCGGSECYDEHCMQGLPMELAMYESLGRLFAMCACMMNPLNVALNPMIWKKLLAANLSLKDLAECDKLSSDLLHRLRRGGRSSTLLNDLTFSLESNDGRVTELLLDGSNISVTEENVDLFVRLATHFRLTQCDVSCTWLARGFNAVLPIGRFRMLLDHKLLEFMVCGDPRIDLEVLRAHTVSSSSQLKRDLFDVLANFDNAKMQLFLRFVSGRSRLPPAQSEWSLYVEYEQLKVRGKTVRYTLTQEDVDNCDNRLPTAATCSFRLLMPKYSSKEIMLQRLSYAIHHCMAIDLDAYQVHDEMHLNSP
ncbi:HECT/ubiquitin-transferase domain containing protein, putative [Babesia bigemina]|uniref:HECT/ubiquitin-transferase domain containing protein, putative n=1 Tax=Babesia bigemina TaxID=5866 RepID=A0A061D3I9_BABBI|nr:HECT/ubiquitin-transferase domain containing protein, putative [Babesia bigemina]CDR94642.1 HECT/ubiquitin-transferase domain containing protein, putative [Babesia bigemina]|eukprot:XP_012766828.1 HECT/ubiquitin-transferase domain containing protein, putative [Babesia bigemina]